MFLHMGLRYGDGLDHLQIHRIPCPQPQLRLALHNLPPQPLLEVLLAAAAKCDSRQSHIRPCRVVLDASADGLRPERNQEAEHQGNGSPETKNPHFQKDGQQEEKSREGDGKKVQDCPSRLTRTLDATMQSFNARGVWRWALAALLLALVLAPSVGALSDLEDGEGKDDEPKVCTPTKVSAGSEGRGWRGAVKGLRDRGAMWIVWGHHWAMWHCN